MLNRNSVILSCYLLVLGLFGLSVIGLSAAPAAPLVSVNVALTRLATPENARQYLGRIEAMQMIDVTTRTEGFITERLFTDGQMVKEGDVLFEIDPALHQTAVALAEAQLESAKANAQHAQVNLNRLQQLGASRSASQAAVDEARAQRDMTRAAVAQSEANLRLQQIQLSYTRITSPITGQVGQSRFHVGSLINPASGSLVNIVQLDPIRIAIAINEKDYISARYKGTKGNDSLSYIPQIRLSNGKLYSESGTFDSIDNQIDTQTGSVVIRTRFNNPQHLLLPGGVVSVSLLPEEPETVTMVPIAALQQNKQGHFVLVVDKENKVEVRPVQLGRQFQQEYEVVEGLKADEQVIVSGIQHVRAGMTVNAHPVASQTVN
ncbi:efflux RND transporter periplasmic adaptor subunit [Budvicia aquatica]|uniref:Efflux RND transporter periplasmic adaptor subunit n=1 Tax=Budvicia aquatica TaxID=82979 RepID=A0A2C6DGF0_9GAMM|nr:efflux RND transporter periplasmic adaptor subunit [Budvicia aquatica]PHI29368.1 efflux RND transporter periplasmic adaptor subunit [Budvicia aquatica]VFS47611.1 Efflux pump periplasmic linker BepF [Budvicia aquatica]